MTVPSEQRALAQQVKAGLRWSLLNTLLTRGGNFIAGVVLARILAPKDFGIYAVALVVMQLLLALNDVGISAPIVRWQGDVEEILPTGMTAVLFVSALLYAALFGLTPLYCGAVHAPQAVGVVRLLGLTVIVDAIFSMPSLMMTRMLRQDRRALSDLTVFVVSTSITVAMATHGFGAWSLAWGQLIGNLAGGFVIFAVTRQPLRLGFQKEAAKHLFKFGLPLTGSSLLLFAMLNLDNIIVGRVLGTTALGLYVLAFNLSGWPVNTLSFTVRRVSLAGLSRLLGDPVALRQNVVRSLGMLLAVTLLLCGLLAALADPIVRFVYGSKWAPAVSAVRFLAVLGACRVMTDYLSDYLIAIGKPRTLLGLQALWVAALVPALSLGAKLHGIAGVGVAHMVVAALIAAPAFLLAVHHTGVRLGQLLRMLWRPVVGGVLGLATAVVAVWYLNGNLTRMAVGTFVAVALFAVMVYPGRAVFGAGAWELAEEPATEPVP